MRLPNLSLWRTIEARANAIITIIQRDWNNISGRYIDSDVYTNIPAIQGSVDSDAINANNNAIVDSTIVFQVKDIYIIDRKLNSIRYNGDIYNINIIVKDPNFKVVNIYAKQEA